MPISLLQELAKKQLPVTIEGGDVVDSVQILILAGHVIAEVAEPVRTPLGWICPRAVVKAITRSGQRMLKVRPPQQSAAPRGDEAFSMLSFEPT